jgi:hypothetical protein
MRNRHRNSDSLVIRAETRRCSSVMSRSFRLVRLECLLRKSADRPQVFRDDRIEILLEKRSISEADDGSQRRSIGMTMRLDVRHGSLGHRRDLHAVAERTGADDERDGPLKAQDEDLVGHAEPPSW